MNTRLQRVEEMVKRAIAEQIFSGNLRDPRLRHVSKISITGVRISADLSHARVYVDVLGNQQEQQNVLRGLQTAAPAIRYELHKQIQLRKVPQLHFEPDASIQAGLAIERVLNEISPKKDPETDPSEQT